MNKLNIFRLPRLFFFIVIAIFNSYTAQVQIYYFNKHSRV